MDVPACNCQYGVPGNHFHYTRFYQDYESYDRAWRASTTYTHPNLLRSFTGGPTPGGFMITYAQCLNLQAHVGQDFYKEISFFGGPLRVVSHENARRLVRELLTVVKDFHNLGLSFGQLLVHNIVFVGQRLCLVGVSVDASDDARVTASFRSIANILRSLYMDHEMPDEFEALVLLLDGDWHDNFGLIYDHPSTWESIRRLAFMRNVADWQSFIPGGNWPDYEFAFNLLDLPWAWDPEEGFTWQDVVPVGTPLWQCLQHRVYNDDLTDLARFVRNVVGHIALYSNQGTLFAQYEIDDMTTYVFPMFLVELETQLYPSFGTTFFTL